MKVTQEKATFQPITIILENEDDAKWMLAIANTSVAEARDTARRMGYDLCKNPVDSQHNLWRGVRHLKEVFIRG